MNYIVFDLEWNQPADGKKNSERKLLFEIIEIGAVKLNEKREIIKSRLGESISLLHKAEAYLMIGFDDNYDLYMSGKKLEKGAYVSVSLFGNAPSDAYNQMTAAICNILAEELGIPSNAVYVTYHGITDWGWNGANF